MGFKSDHLYSKAHFITLITHTQHFNVGSGYKWLVQNTTGQKTPIRCRQFDSSSPIWFRMLEQRFDRINQIFHDFHRRQ